MRKASILNLLAVTSVFAACQSAPEMPVMGECVVYNIDVEEISGICLNADKSALLACGDQGVIRQISFDGEVTPVLDFYADMEGVTVDHNTGHLYVAAEWDQSVLRFDAPDYQTCTTLFYVQEAIDNEYKNSGLEGISHYKDDIFFIGSQREANLWQYKADGTMLSKISLSDFADEVAGLCYDPEGDWLWVIDSNFVKMYICTVDGELLATYDLGDIENAESICVDRERDCVWVGSDEDSPKLYRFTFDF